MLKLLMTPQTSPPSAGLPTGCTPPATPPCPSDVSTQQAVRFIRGDRDSVINELLIAQGSPVYGDPQGFRTTTIRLPDR